MSEPLLMPLWHIDEDPAPLECYVVHDEDAVDGWYEEPDEEWRVALGGLDDYVPCVRFEDDKHDGLDDQPGLESDAAADAFWESVRERPVVRPRPPSPLTSARVGELLLKQVGDVELEDLRRLLRRGRPARADDELRCALSLAIHQLRELRRVRVSTLAAVLQCDPATIWRQAQRGARLEQA